MADVINWGVLGAARFALTTMAPAIHAARGARLAALATASPDKADAARAFAPDLRVHDSYDALLADPEIDAVYIPLPNHMHAPWSLKALAAGKPVLCEKPVGMDVAEIDALIAARDASGLLAAEAFMIPHHPQWPRVRALVADGALGEIVHVAAAFAIDTGDEPQNIRNRRETGGGGLRDIGVYAIGGPRYALGQEPANWTARVVWENGVDIHVEAQADLGPARLAIRTSMRAAPWQEVVIHGTRGLLRMTAPFNPDVFAAPRLELRRSGRETLVETFPGALQYVLQVEAFGETMRTGAPYVVPLEFSRGTQAAIDAILAAA
jgi:predicted dehydrogenase